MLIHKTQKIVTQGGVVMQVAVWRMPVVSLVRQVDLEAVRKGFPHRNPVLRGTIQPVQDDKGGAFPEFSEK
jgi:hypothetical protein